jgi:hypothetical protein
LITACLSVSFAPAGEAPEQPVLISPPDGARGVPARASLCVAVSDPEGDEVDVSFSGRRAARDFTVVVLPDTQKYAESRPEIFDAQVQWIVDSREARDIVFATQLGDCVQNPELQLEWDRADASLSLLEDPVSTGLADGVPFGIAPGNHDVEMDLARSGSAAGSESATTSLYNQFFGRSRFDGREYYGGRYDFDDPGQYPENNDNHFELFSGGDTDFLVLHLEWDMSDSAERREVLDWAERVVMAHPERLAIVVAHFILTEDSSFSDQGAAIYEQLKDNRNVVLMLSGHDPEAARRSDVFEGHVITSLLSNYQFRADGGGGYLRIMTFSPARGEIRVETYSPWLDAFDRSPEHDFTLEYEPRPASAPLAIARVEDVSSGSEVCVDWTGRREDTDYEWSVSVSDGVSTTRGPAWLFASDGSCVADPDCSDSCVVGSCEDGLCSASNDPDHDRDGVCSDLDNCPSIPNRLQRDDDLDGVGNVCDVCPNTADPQQEDADGDLSGDACDCQPTDRRDRIAALVTELTVTGASSAARVSWSPSLGADAYSVTRGRLSLLAAESFGGCVAEGIEETAFEDPATPPVGDGWFYLVQGHSYDCGLGELGRDSAERSRVNLDAGACVGPTLTDVYPTGESTLAGSTSGETGSLGASDDSRQTLTEEVIGGASSGYSDLEHRWQFELPAGIRAELHVEAFRSESPDGDDFVFELSVDGGESWSAIDLARLPMSDSNVDRIAPLPPDTSGTVLIRCVDTDSTAGSQDLDQISIDELFVRIVH